MITVLTGGTGGAKFVDGLRQIVPPEDLTIIVNTGDDFRWWGLHISPDLDSITYMMADKLSPERGWGVQRDTFYCLQAMRQLGQPSWFNAGDRDLATHIFRSKLLAEGKTLTEATSEIAAHLGIKTRILPMTDSRVETRVLTPAGDLSFQEYFVQRRYQDHVESVRFVGVSDARPAPNVVDAILSSDIVLLAPSNPVTSIAPILSVPGIRDALRHTRACVVAVSPIVGGLAVTGPAAALLVSQGFHPTIAGVADYYRDFLDVLVIDSQDEPAGKAATMEVRFYPAPTIMRRNEDRVALAKSALDAALQSPAETAVRKRA